jgi:dihydrofolate reductase
MGKLIVSEFMTLDGVMEDPGSWNIPFMNEAAEKYKYNEIMAAEALLLGGTTYKEFGAAWPNIDAGEFSKKINSMKKYVVSPDLADTDLTWGETVQIKDNVAEEIRKLKEYSGDLLVNGSSELLQTLIENDLVDEYRIQLHPVLWGEGKKLFKEGFGNKQLTLTDCQALENGLILLTFVPNANPTATPRP